MTPRMLELPTYIRCAKTARVAAGMKQKAVAELATELSDRGFEFNKAWVQRVEASKPVPFIEAENYVSALLTLPQKSCVPDIVFNLRKKRPVLQSKREL